MLILFIFFCSKKLLSPSKNMVIAVEYLNCFSKTIHHTTYVQKMGPRTQTKSSFLCSCYNKSEEGGGVNIIYQLKLEGIRTLIFISGQGQFFFCIEGPITPIRPSRLPHFEIIQILHLYSRINLVKRFLYTPRMRESCTLQYIKVF